MFIKLAIIGSVLLVAVIAFPNEIYQLFPETSSNITDATKNDLQKITDDAIQKTGTTISAGGKLINNQVKDFAEGSTESISKSLNDFSESAQQVVNVGIFGNDQNENNNESLVRRDSSSIKTNSATESSFSTIATKVKQSKHLKHCLFHLASYQMIMLCFAMKILLGKQSASL